MSVVVKETEPYISLNSLVKTQVTFFNRCHRRAALYWYDFKGKLVRYAILGKGENMIMDTYVTHPWCSRDAVTGDRLLVGGDHVYFPVEPDEDGNDEREIFVYIDLPGK